MVLTQVSLVLAACSVVFLHSELSTAGWFLVHH